MPPGRSPAQETERDHLSVKLYDLSVPAPIYATLIEVDGQDGLQLTWSRPTATDRLHSGPVNQAGPLNHGARPVVVASSRLSPVVSVGTARHMW